MKEHDYVREKLNKGEHYSEKGCHKLRSNFWKMIRREKRVIVRQRIERSQNENTSGNPEGTPNVTIS